MVANIFWIHKNRQFSLIVYNDNENFDYDFNYRYERMKSFYVLL